MTVDATRATPLLRLASVCKNHTHAGTSVQAVANIDLDLLPATVHLLTGASGSGKSTLLGLVAGYDHPDSGQFIWRNDLNPRTWSTVASVPQSLALMPDLTLGENIALVLRLTRLPPGHADHLCELLDVAHLLRRYARQASLGEQQRVALVRALCVAPTMLVVDEPTAHQDAARAALIHQQLSDAARKGACILATSHDPDFAEYADRTHLMRDGTLSTRSQDEPTAFPRLDTS